MKAGSGSGVISILSPKNLTTPHKAHAGTIKVTQILTPVIVCMAGDTFDPYKD